MDNTPARSLAGAARRSRRLQGTPAGHSGSATTASGSPYARPTLKRVSSSQTLAALESGGSGPANGKELSKLDRRKSVASSDGIFGRVRRGLGWLVGRSSENATEEEAENESNERGQNDDEESMLTGSNRPRTRALPARAAMQTSSKPTQFPPMSMSKREYDNSTSVLSGDLDGDESAKKLRTSHSTLNLPRRASPPKSTRKPHSSAGAAPSRALSPGRPLSPRYGLPESQGRASMQGKSSIFPSGPLNNVTQSHMNGFSTASRGSVSPGGMSQYALASQPTSGTSTTFGLQSQSPFRIGGHTARSPDLAALNISSGLARSPSLPAERLLTLQRTGPRLYPYQRSPSILSGLARPPALPTSFSVHSSLATGSKRDYGAMSMSPPKISPGSQAFYRASPSGLNASPTNTDFGSDFSHRSKRQRVSVAWHPDKGFVSTDAEGNPLHDGGPPPSIPKNEAERILERLENLRRPQIEGLRSSSPRRLNVPLPTSTPGKGSIFATQISSSRTEPALSSYAISPYARRQQAYREERALRRDIINSRGGLGEHLRMASMDQDVAQAQSQEINEDRSDHFDDGRSDADAASNIDEQGDEEVSLPKPVKRRTRQRTRELSVMSDTDIQQDDTLSSLRRSTRLRNKPTMEEAQSPRREGKSAKSPPPTDKKGTVGGKKSRQTAVDESDGAVDEMDEDRPSRAASPRRAKSPAKNNGLGSRPASPQPTSRNTATIDQVILGDDKPEVPSIATPKLSAREQRLNSVQNRKTRGFSAKDDFDDEPVESSAAPEQPKLKLPNSVFANRFSFGRSPSSSLLASPTPQVASANGSSNISSSAPPQVVVQPLPKLALPASTSSNLFAAPPAPTPATAVPAAASSTSRSNNQVADAPVISSGFAANSLPGSSSAESAATKPPLFAFKAPENASQVAASAKDSEVATKATKPTFPFAGASSTNGAVVGEKTTPPFTFGQTSSEPKAENTAAPSFNFGKPAATKADETVTTIDLTKPSNPFAAFPSAASSAASAGTDASAAPKKPTFSFAPANASPATAASPSTTNSAPSFNFGGASSSTAAFGQPKPSEREGMQASPPPAANANGTPAAAPFSPVIQASKPPAFSFGQTANTNASTTTPAASTPSFSFGAQSSTQNEAKSRSSSPFAVGAPAQPFSFGKKDEADRPATPAFSFGAPSNTTKETDKPAPSGFAFGASSAAAPLSGSTPAFSFGAPKPASTNPFAAVAPAMQPSGSAFGSTVPQPSPGFGQNTASGTNSTPSFNFGTQPNGSQSAATPSAFSFGANSTPAATATTNTPSFSFGAGATTGAQPFAFGGASAVASPAANSAVPSFNFSAGAGTVSQVGSPAGTPTGTGPAGGNFFTMGAGDPTSPNKARRPVKPLRRPR